MLPKGWGRVPLHKIAEVHTGLAKGKRGLKDPVDLPYIRVANVQDGHFNLSNIKSGKYQSLIGITTYKEGFSSIAFKSTLLLESESINCTESVLTTVSTSTR